MYRLKSRTAGFLVLFAVGGAPQVWGQQNGRAVSLVPTDSVPSHDDSVASLAAKVEELDQQVRILTRLREISTDSAARMRGVSVAE